MLDESAGAGSEATVSRPRIWLLIATGIVVGVLAIPLVALAITHSFADVPESHPFFSEIEAIKKAGITQGSNECNPAVTPAYCPDSGVRRDAMAAFMERGFTRVEAAEGDAIANDTSDMTVATATLEAGATGAGTNGYALVTVSATVFAESSCPCIVGLGIIDNGIFVAADYTLVASDRIAEKSFQAMIPVPGNSSHNYSLITTVLDSVGITPSAQVYGQLTAVYVPFDGDATNTSGGTVVGPTASTLEAYLVANKAAMLDRAIDALSQLR